MQIFLNGKFASQKITGVQRVAIEHKRYLSDFGVHCICPPKNINKSIFLIFWEQFVLPFKVPKNSLLLSMCNMGPVFLKNQIVFIHDLAFERQRSWFSLGFRLYYKFFIPLIARRSFHVLTCSEFTKKELIEFYSLSQDKISVVPNGVSDFFSSIGAERVYKSKKENPFVLFVGTMDPRKNLISLLKIWSECNFSDLGWRLKVAGGYSSIFSKDILNDFISDNSIEFLGYVTDEELKSLYCSASIFVYPSLYEGFGLPPLEAMAAGCPTLVSNAGALVEAVGDSAEVFNLNSIESFKEKLCYLIENPDAREALSKKSVLMASKFTWEKSAKKLNAILSEIKSDLNIID